MSGRVIKRNRYLYRLHVDADGVDEPDHWVDADGNERTGWPPARIYQSQYAAERRADLLRSLGATVTVERSDPVTWRTP